MTEIISKEGAKVQYFCDNCDNKTKKYQSLFNKNGGNFCGRQCANEFNAKSGKDSPQWKNLVFECEVCNDEFEADNSNNANRFCSRVCFHKWERREDLDEVCNVCGEEFRRQNHHKGKYCSKKCQGIAFRGSGSPTWKGGYQYYYGENWYEQRRKAWRRDQYRCQNCGKSENSIGRKPDVHHKTPFREFDDYKKANKTKNLISLCHVCHMQEEYND